MGRFEGFYTDGEDNVDNSGFTGSEMFTQRRLKREREQAKAKQLEQWKLELQQCTGRKSLKQYIEKYKSNKENPYVKNAEDKIDDLDFKAWNGDTYNLAKYIKTHPCGRHVSEAKDLITKIRSDTLKRESIRLDRQEKLDNVILVACILIFIVVFCLLFFESKSSFKEAGGAALGAAAPVFLLYRAIIRPFFE